MDARRTRKSNRSNLPVVRIWIIEVQRSRNLRMRQVPLDLFWDGCKADEKVKPQQPSGCEDLNYRSPTRQTLKTNQGGIAQLARASALQAEGRRFESVYLHQTGVTIRKIVTPVFFVAPNALSCTFSLQNLSMKPSKNNLHHLSHSFRSIFRFHRPFLRSA